MTLPVQVTFHGLPTSPALFDYVQKKAEKLHRLHRRITRFRVAVEAAHKHQRAGAFRVRIELGVPRDALVVGGHHAEPQEDAYAAVDAAFDEARRMLRDHAARARATRHEPRGL